MSKTKNHNSILFLTTLGLYIGLVMVGGSTSALAQKTPVRQTVKAAAQPAGANTKVDFYNEVYVLSVVRLVEELDRLGKRGHFNWASSLNYEIEELYIGDDGYPVSFGSGNIGKAGDTVYGSALKIANGIFAKKTLFGPADFGSYQLDYKFNLEKDTLDITATVKNPNDHPAFLKWLSAHLAKQSPAAIPGARGKVVAEKTSITTANDQVTIVTRLPRGSIDQLLRS